MWMDPTWMARWPVSIDNTAGGTDPQDVELQLGPEHTSIWTIVKSTGADLRFCRADGRMPLSFKRHAWDYAQRSAVLQLDAVPMKAGVVGAWLYAGNATAPDGATTPTISTPRAASIWPGRLAAPVVVAESRSGRYPTQQVRKTAGETLRITWDLRADLAPASGLIAGRRAWEEIAAVTLIDVVTAQGSSQAGMMEPTKTAIGAGWVSTVIKAGTTGTTYIASIRVETTLNRVLERHVRVVVTPLEV